MSSKLMKLNLATNLVVNMLSLFLIGCQSSMVSRNQADKNTKTYSKYTIPEGKDEAYIHFATLKDGAYGPTNRYLFIPSVKKDHEIRQMQLITNYEIPRYVGKIPAVSEVEEIAYDCQAERIKIYYSRFYSEPFGQGAEVKNPGIDSQLQSKWVPMLKSSGSIIESTCGEIPLSPLMSRVSYHEEVINLRKKILQNIKFPKSTPASAEAIYRITLLPDGAVSSVEVKQSSGDQDLDRIVERGIFKSSPLPVPDTTTPQQFIDLRIKFR